MKKTTKILIFSSLIYLISSKANSHCKIKKWNKGLLSEESFQNLLLDYRVYKYINFYSNTPQGREFITQSIENSKKFLSYIVSEMRIRGLPEGLSLLPIIESGFYPKAISKSNAVGLWQFLKSVAIQYGLTIDRYVDERMDPEKSTIAAIKHLKNLYKLFRAWDLAITAYNSGGGYLLRIIKIYKSRNLWFLYPYIKEEPRAYFPKFIAVLYIANNAKDLGFPELKCYPPNYEILFVRGGTTLKEIANEFDLYYQTLKDLNPELKTDIIPPYVKLYPLKIPQNAPGGS